MLYLNEYIDTTMEQNTPYCMLNESLTKKNGASQLVKLLSSVEGFCLDIEVVSEILGYKCLSIYELTYDYWYLFTIMTDNVSSKSILKLFPHTKICNDFKNSVGCHSSECNLLHICPNYLCKRCRVENCPLSHEVKTFHNNKILSSFFLDQFEETKLFQMLPKILIIDEKYRICSLYNQNGCDLGEYCEDLHICFLYVKNLGKCPNTFDCKLSHDVTGLKRKFFYSLGISLTKNPQDLLKIVKNKCIADHIPEEATKMQSKQEEKIIGSTSKNSKPIDKNKLKRKVYFFNLNGNPKTPFICKNFDCNIGNCKYFHSKSPFFWQFGKDNRWYNFTSYHSNLLERSYQDVNCESFTLPKINSYRMRKTLLGLLSVLGKEDLKINFIPMTITCKGKPGSYSIRRLHKEISSGCSSNFFWYIKNEHGKWILYNEFNIESYYLEYPNKLLLQEVDGVVYQFDFTHWTRLNLKMDIVTQLRRRPKPTFLKEEEEEGKKTIDELPILWDDIKDGNIYHLFDVLADSKEYKAIQEALLNSYEIIAMKRIHNSYTLKLFRNRQVQLKSTYGETVLNRKRLYCTIDSSNPNAFIEILKFNLDYRVHSYSDVEGAYGVGICFFIGPSEALKYGKGKNDRVRYLLVVDVALGKVTEGYRGATTPIWNPETDLFFDTSVDSLILPTIYVKHVKQDYCPSFIVACKSKY